jgi:hypothetical protein
LKEGRKEGRKERGEEGGREGGRKKHKFEKNIIHVVTLRQNK